ARGTSTWSQVSTSDNSLAIRGPGYWADLSSLPNDLYDYDIAYTRPGESTPFVEGSGTFSISSSNNSSTNSVNVAGFVDDPSLGLILRGNTTGLSGVTIKDASGNTVDTRTLANGKMTSLGS